MAGVEACVGVDSPATNPASWEMAQIAIEETAVAMTQLVLDLREPA